jgi:hypothetical protein
MSKRPMIPGVEYDFGGGRVYMLAPLSLGALEVLQERLTALPTLEAMDPVAIRTMTDATHMALLRNYPEITRAEVGELVDVSIIGDVYECLLDAAGVRRKAQAAERGNAQAKSQSAGAGSSPESAPTPAGPGTTSEPT